VKFYLIGNILDNDYLNNYNYLQYENLCAMSNKTGNQCNSYFGEIYVLILLCK